MAHITLSVPNDVYAAMKQHPEIKWSEVARKSITEKIYSLKDTLTGEEFLELLSPETRKSLQITSKKEWIAFYKKGKKREQWKQKKYLTPP